MSNDIVLIECDYELNLPHIVGLHTATVDNLKDTELKDALVVVLPRGYEPERERSNPELTEVVFNRMNLQAGYSPWVFTEDIARPILCRLLADTACRGHASYFKPFIEERIGELRTRTESVVADASGPIDGGVGGGSESDPGTDSDSGE